MNQKTEFLLGLSCLLPMLYYLFYFNRIDKRYQFLFYLLLTDVAIEILNNTNTQQFLWIDTFKKCYFNIYLFINFLVFLWLVYKNKYTGKTLIALTVSIALAVFIANGLLEKSFNAYFFFFLCYVSSIMLFISIKILSAQIFETSKSWYKNFWFLFSSACILYHSFTVLIFGLFYFSLFDTPNGRSVVYIHHFINVFYYLLMLWAIYLLPKKPILTLPIKKINV